MGTISLSPVRLFQIRAAKAPNFGKKKQFHRLRLSCHLLILTDCPLILSFDEIYHFVRNPNFGSKSDAQKSASRSKAIVIILHRAGVRVLAQKSSNIRPPPHLKFCAENLWLYHLYPKISDPLFVVTKEMEEFSRFRHTFLDVCVREGWGVCASTF